MTVTRGWNDKICRQHDRYFVKWFAGSYQQSVTKSSWKLATSLLSVRHDELLDDVHLSIADERTSEAENLENLKLLWDFLL